MSLRRPFSLLLLIAAGGLAAPATAPASTVEIGSVAEIRGDFAPTEPTNGGDTVQIAESSGTYAVPPGYGVITALEHRTGSVGGTLTFKVYRPVGARSFFTLASLPRTVTAGAQHTFAVRVPVRPGDRLGLSSADDTVHQAYQNFNVADKFAFLPIGSNPAPGTTVTQDGDPAPGYRLDVLARVETDADGDGFGDDSQDRCPTRASTQGVCPSTPPLPGFAGCSARTANVLRGTAAANRIAGTPRGDRIFAGPGNDTVDGSGGADCIDLESGDDRAQGGSGGDTLVGGTGKDRLAGGSGNDRLRGRSGNDRASGGGGRDSMDGGSGSDLIKGDSGNDRISGGSGGDRISAGGGNDRVSARDRRRDRISCGRGRDSVTADRGDRVARDCERVRRR